MGVYVKGMKMPKECRECYLLEYYEYLGETQCSITRMMLAEREKPIPFDGRPKWCPLVEVPEPHGRLIDADALLSKAKFLYKGYEIALTDAIGDAPTIIEADKEGAK